MFKIIKASDGTVLALTEDVTYIKKADNGCYILCPEPDASGISYTGTPYHLLDRDPMGDDLESVCWSRPILEAGSRKPKPPSRMLMLSTWIRRIA